MTMDDYRSALNSLAAAYDSDVLSVGDRVWVFHKQVHTGWHERGPAARATVTEVLIHGKAVEVEYPDGGREKLKVLGHLGFMAVPERAE